LIPTRRGDRNQPLACEGRFDYLLMEATGILEPLPAAEPRLGRRTVLTLQKARSGAVACITWPSNPETLQREP
jgi:G3E family GTPase